MPYLPYNSRGYPLVSRRTRFERKTAVYAASIHLLYVEFIGVTALIIVGASAFLGACVQGSVGFGMNMVAAPCVALSAPELIPGPLLVATLAVAAPSAVAEWRAIKWQELGVSVTGRIPGTLAGAVAVVLLPLHWISIAVALAILIGVSVQLQKPRSEVAHPAPITTPRLLAASATSGFMGTSSTIGGPPMAMLYAPHGAAKMRATLSAFFSIGTLLSLVTLSIMGAADTSTLLHGAVLIPFVLLGWGASWLAKPYIKDPQRLVRIVAMFSGTAAVGILAQAVW